MYIAILVLLGIAGAIWYFARKQAQTTYSLTAEQTAELNRQIDRDAALATAAAEPTPAPSSSNVDLPSQKVKAAISLDESASTPPEVAAEKAAIQAQQDALAEAQLKAATESTEASKPPKKKRRYYPKKK